METKSISRSFWPLTIIFIVTTGLFIAARPLFDRWHMDTNVLLGGNLILFGVTILSFYFYSRVIHSKNIYAILRMMYGSMLVRMFVCIIAAFIYISQVGKDVSKGAIFGCMFLYIVYTGVEISILLKISKQKKNA